MKKTDFTFIDLFAGCGGLSEGFLQSKRFKGLAHVEWELPMVETLRKRLNTHWNHSVEESMKAVVHFDIQKTDELLNGKWRDDTINKFGKTNDNGIIENGLKGLIGKKSVDLIIGGPPCQAYSIAGRAQDNNSMKDDYRNYLFESFVKVVEAFKPSLFVFENVPGILSARPGDRAVTERIFNAFDKVGYSILEPGKLKNATFSASDFGVPQKRKRVIIIGTRKDSKINLAELYNAVKKQCENFSEKSVKDVIGHLPAIKPLNESLRHKGRNVSHVIESTVISVKLHEPRFHNSRDVAIFREWVSKNMNSLKSDEKIKFYNDLIGKKSKHGKYRSLEWHKPSPTLVAHLYKDGLMFIHPDAEQARSITVREAALLQSFSEDYEFIGSQGTCFKMIGNAVPPSMAKGIAEGIITELDKTKKI
jgi:DNA (cytosine-5)-methyltransferase 1